MAESENRTLTQDAPITRAKGLLSAAAAQRSSSMILTTVNTMTPIDKHEPQKAGFSCSRTFKIKRRDFPLKLAVDELLFFLDERKGKICLQIYFGGLHGNTGVNGAFNFKHAGRKFSS